MKADDKWAALADELRLSLGLIDERLRRLGALDPLLERLDQAVRSLETRATKEVADIAAAGIRAYRRWMFAAISILVVHTMISLYAALFIGR